MTEIIGPNWTDELLSLVKKAKKEVFMVVPYFSGSAVSTLLSALAKEVGFRALVGFDYGDILSGASDYGSLITLAEAGEVRYLRQVHAKVYIIDAQEAIVSSANLTDPGLESNLEIGVRLGETKAVSQLIEILKPFWDAAKPINPESLPFLEEITKFMDKYETGRAEHELDLVCEMDPSNGLKQLLEGADTAGRIIWRTKRTTYVKSTRTLVEENMPDRATIRYRDRLLKELRPLMTQGKIARLTKGDVEFILSELQGGFGAIGLPNIDLILENGIGKMRSDLLYLFWGDGDDQTRLANMLLPGIRHLDGAGIGVLSTLLMVSNPDRYPIYNESIRRGLEFLLPNVTLRSDASDYLHFAEVAADLKERYSIPNSALDFVLWSIGKSETET